jgi:hypothetical protein
MEERVSFVTERSKKDLWAAVSSHFNLPLAPTEDNEAILQVKEKVKDWALKNMATQFLSFKKRLYMHFINKGRTLKFTAPLEKIINH